MRGLQIRMGAVGCLLKCQFVVEKVSSGCFTQVYSILQVVVERGVASAAHVRCNHACLPARSCHYALTMYPYGDCEHDMHGCPPLLPVLSFCCVAPQPLQLWLVLYDLLVVSQKETQAQAQQASDQAGSQTDRVTSMQVDGGSAVEDSKKSARDGKEEGLSARCVQLMWEKGDSCVTAAVSFCVLRLYGMHHGGAPT